MDSGKCVEMRARYIQAQPDDIRAALLETELIRQRSSIWSTRCFVALTACIVVATAMLAISNIAYLFMRF